jgi:hypothetical protein
MIAVCENPRFLLFAGDEGNGTKTGSCNSFGQWPTRRSVTEGIRLVSPFSLMALTISEASCVYSDTQNPVTPETSIELNKVGNSSLHFKHKGAPNLLQMMQGVGKTKSRIFDIAEVSNSFLSYVVGFLELLKTKRCQLQVAVEIQKL